MTHRVVAGSAQFRVVDTELIMSEVSFFVSLNRSDYVPLFTFNISEWLQVTMAALLCLPSRTLFEIDFQIPLLQIKLQTNQSYRNPSLEWNLILIQLNWSGESLA